MIYSLSLLEMRRRRRFPCISEVHLFALGRIEACQTFELEQYPNPVFDTDKTVKLIEKHTEILRK
jgi:hypothetical protein